LVPLWRLTTDGSQRTTPLPCTEIRVFAVPKSIARSLDSSPLILLISKVDPLLPVACLCNLSPRLGETATAFSLENRGASGDACQEFLLQFAIKSLKVLHNLYVRAVVATMSAAFHA
jgi:hypothetical protein